MVLKILPHPGEIHDDGNADLLEQSSRSDARGLKNLRGADCTGCENHFGVRLRLMQLAAMFVFDANGFPSFEENTRGLRVDFHCQILAFPRRTEKPLVGPASKTFLSVLLVVAESFLRGTL